MATYSDLDAIARALPEVDVHFSTDDRPTYRVRHKLFLVLRGRRKDAVDAVTGEMLDDVIVFRTRDLAAKERLLADASLPCFTTPHFHGWPGVLIRAGDLRQVTASTLRDLVEQAWLAQAPKSLAKQWKAGREGAEPRP